MTKYFVDEKNPQKIYREPTDDDARQRVVLEVRDHDTYSWRDRCLLAVLPVSQKPFCVLTEDSAACVRYKHARIDTGIVIPDGWRLVDTSNEPWRAGAKVWRENYGTWGDSFNRVDWTTGYIYIVPIDPPEPTADDYLAGHKASGLKVGDRVRVMRKAKDREHGWEAVWLHSMNGMVGRNVTISEDGGVIGFKIENANYSLPHFILEKVEPQYRPFATAKEWMEHKDRFVVNRDGDIMRHEWFGANNAKDCFKAGLRFANEDGAPGEPYGVRVE